MGEKKHCNSSLVFAYASPLFLLRKKKYFKNLKGLVVKILLFNGIGWKNNII